MTRIEMGVQTTDDEILRLNRRGHTLQQVRDAVHLMRQYGFKISLHLMP
ncbi:MAG: radical SAM protein [Candidatus Peribacteria bacterium]|nr:radical SAM protein [Candidatus Peribacteria bacterium]